MTAADAGILHFGRAPALNLAPDTYLQAQLSEWIPLSSDSGAGAVLLDARVTGEAAPHSFAGVCASTASASPDGITATIQAIGPQPSYRLMPEPAPWDYSWHSRQAGAPPPGRLTAVIRGWSIQQSSRPPRPTRGRSSR